jgi:membrane carboxypeptidase/penicillin-binding protein
MQTNLAQLARAYLVFANDGAIPSLKLINGIATNEQKTQVFSKQTTHRIAERRPKPNLLQVSYKSSFVNLSATLTVPKLCDFCKIFLTVIYL